MLVRSGQLFEMIGLDSCPFPTWSLSCSGIVRHITGTKGLLRKQVRNLWFVNDCGSQDGPGDPTKWPFSFPMCRISGLYKLGRKTQWHLSFAFINYSQSLAGLGIYIDVEASDRPHVPFIRCIHPFNFIKLRSLTALKLAKWPRLASQQAPGTFLCAPQLWGYENTPLCLASKAGTGDPTRSPRSHASIL